MSEGRISITINNSLDNKKYKASPAESTTVGRLIESTKEKLKLDKNAKFMLTKGKETLKNEQTLAQAGVKDNDTLDLIPSATGGFH